ncbi:MAG TPA: YhfC family glutamic-type intramembrane protease, partial [Gemmatimonadales bacterium]|nr:YhfC family glutamic-type intramembrane protease [Gemmatimonadales bacterium]
HSEWLVSFVLFSSLTAGLFEETGRWLGYRHLLTAERSRRVAIMFGLGHGALEAILLAGMPLGGLLLGWVLAAQGRLPPEAANAIRQQTEMLDFWKIQLAALERASAIGVHVGLALVVLQIWKRGGMRWLFLAILLHFSINATAAVLVLKLQLSPWVGELVLVVMAAIVLGLGLHLSSSEQHE